MITKLNHVSIFVLNQDSAYDFYINKLGFTVNTDAEMGPGKRWLTVTPPDQPELEITLMLIDDGMMFTTESAAAMRDLVSQGHLRFRRLRMRRPARDLRGADRQGRRIHKAPDQGILRLRSAVQGRFGQLVFARAEEVEFFPVTIYSMASIRFRNILTSL